MSPAVQSSSSVRLQVIPVAELTPDQVAAYGKVFSGPLPDSGWVVIAVEGNTIIGFSTLQSVWHVGGTWVAPSHRGSSLFGRLVNALFQALPVDIPGVLVTTDNPKMPSVLTRLGLEELQVKTFRWLRNRS